MFTSDLNIIQVWWDCTINDTESIVKWAPSHTFIIVTGGKHELVPQSVFTEAEKFAKVGEIKLKVTFNEMLIVFVHVYTIE